MSDLLGYGRSSRHTGPVRFATSDKTASDVEKRQATPEELADIEERCRRKYRFETIRKKPTIHTYLDRAPKRREANTRPEEEKERARRQYIACRASGLNRTRTLDTLSIALGITHHEFYKLLKEWGYRDVNKENADVSAHGLSKSIETDQTL